MGFDTYYYLVMCRLCTREETTKILKELNSRINTRDINQDQINNEMCVSNIDYFEPLINLEGFPVLFCTDENQEKYYIVCQEYYGDITNMGCFSDKLVITEPYDERYGLHVIKDSF